MRRREVRAGLTGIVLALALAVVCGVVYLDPFGHRTIAMELTNSGGLTTGDEVRIAGIAVGEVTAIDLHPDRVTVEMAIDNDVAINDATAADVRLVTAIGGHYVAVRPAGRTPLTGPIPMDRTTVPYTLADVISDSGSVIRRVEGASIGDTLRTVDAVLAGEPTAIREIIADTEELTTAVGDRAEDLDKAVALSEEYLAGLNSGRANLVEMLRLIGFVGAKAYQVKAEGVETVRSIGALFAFVGKPINAFTGTIEPEVQQVLGLLERLRQQPAAIDDLLTRLRSVVAQISSAMGITDDGTVDVSQVVVDAPSISVSPESVGRTLCVPSAERRC